MPGMQCRSRIAAVSELTGDSESDLCLLDHCEKAWSASAVLVAVASGLGGLSVLLAVAVKEDDSSTTATRRAVCLIMLLGWKACTVLFDECRSGWRPEGHRARPTSTLRLVT